MSNKILTVTEKGGLSVVPGAHMVIPCADSHFKAVASPVPNPNGRGGKMPCIAKLWRAAPGKYAVEADDTLLAKLDTAKDAKTFEVFALSASAADWPCKEDDGSIKIPSKLGLDDSRPALAIKDAVAELEKVR